MSKEACDIMNPMSDSRDEYTAAQGQDVVLHIARGYAVADSPLHVNRLACALLALHDENERLHREREELRNEVVRLNKVIAYGVTR